MPLLTFPNTQPHELRELSRSDWLEHMRRMWSQGEHIAIAGRTGRGKTTLARDLLGIRRWVIALAVKRDDDTLATFPKAGYRKLRRWPPNWDDEHVVFWPRPKDLDDIGQQARLVKQVLNDVFRNGGWALLLDDLAYTANVLGFKRYITVMFNQSRSSGVSLVSCMTQPSSVSQSIPSEAWRQVRFVVSFKYHATRDMEVIAGMMGYPPKVVEHWMDQLGPRDFLAYDNDVDEVVLVRS